MSNSTRATGKAFYLSLDGTTLGQAFVSWEFDQTIDTVEKTAGSEGSKSYIAQHIDATASVTYQYEGGTTNLPITALFTPSATERALIWGDEGSAAGKPKGGGTVIVMGHSKPVNFKEVMQRTVKFQFTGGITINPDTQVW